MKKAAIALGLLLAAAPARPWRLFGEPSDGRIRPVQALNDQRKSKEVIAALTPGFIQSLRGTDLRQAYVLLGDNLQILGRVDEALGAYQLGASLFPKNVDLLTRLGDLLHRAGLDERAKPLYLRALAGEPRHYGAHLGLAEISRKQGSLNDAASHYEAALESLGSRADVWRDYAQVLIFQRDYVSAEPALRKSLELDPKSAEAYVLLGFARRGQGDLDSALERLDQALGLGAGIGAKRARALWLLEAGRLEAAQLQAKEVQKDVPDDGAARWVLAQVELAGGRNAQAKQILSTASDHDAGFCARAARALRAVL